MSELPAPRLTCRELVELLSDYLDGALPPREGARVAAHLETCPECIAYLVQLRTTIGALGRLRQDGADP
jgi:anti-sigma factor RsiW